MKLFLRDAALVLATMTGLFLVMAAMGRSVTVFALVMGASVGLMFAAARAWRRVLEERAAARRKPRQGR
jgi:UPF0716 family protein affecting phage T7 exclusion